MRRLGLAAAAERVDQRLQRVAGVGGILSRVAIQKAVLEPNPERQVASQRAERAQRERPAARRTRPRRRQPSGARPTGSAHPRWSRRIVPPRDRSSTRRSAGSWPRPTSPARAAPPPRARPAPSGRLSIARADSPFRKLKPGAWILSASPTVSTVTVCADDAHRPADASKRQQHDGGVPGGCYHRTQPRGQAHSHGEHSASDCRCSAGSRRRGRPVRRGTRSLSETRTLALGVRVPDRTDVEEEREPGIAILDRRVETCGRRRPARCRTCPSPRASPNRPA